MTGNTFNFLDLSLNLNPDGKFSSAVYIKPTDQGLYTNFNSNTPLAYKKSVVKTLIHRALKYSSDWNAYNSEINKIKQVLADNNYPQRMIEETINNYIDSNICHGISLKKPSGNAGIRSQQKCYALDHHTSPKKDASSQELSNTVFSHSSNVNSHIITDAIFVM